MVSYNRVIFGFGNYLKGDDAIGLEVVHYINDKMDIDKRLKAVDIGNDGMLMLTYFEDDLDKVLIIDCAMVGLEPGNYRIFTPDEVKSKKKLANVSTHESDIIKIIELGKSIGYKIPSIKLLGIQPVSMKDNTNLSDLLKSKLHHYAEIAIQEVTK
jgi:hydrogenase maturation protease